MKKIFLVLALFAGLNLSAQELFKQFNAGEYARDLTLRIYEDLHITQPEQRDAVRKAVYIYAQSIKKHILVAEKSGRTEGKTLEEVIEMVKPEALDASKLYQNLSFVLTQEQVDRIKRLI